MNPDFDEKESLTFRVKSLEESLASSIEENEELITRLKYHKGTIDRIEQENVVLRARLHRAKDVLFDALTRNDEQRSYCLHCRMSPGGVCVEHSTVRLSVTSEGGA